MLNSLTELVGSRSLPIERIRDKKIIAQICEMAVESTACEVRLRACLSTGVPPPLDLLVPQVIVSSLSLDDCLRFMPQLTHLERVLDATAVLGACSTFIRREGLSAKRVASRLLNFLKGVKKARTRLSAISVNTLLLLVSNLIEIENPSGRSSSQDQRLKSLLIGTAGWTSYATDAEAFRAYLAAMNRLNSKRILSVSDIAAENLIFRTELETVRGTAERIALKLAVDGDAEQFHLFARELYNFPVGREATLQFFERVYLDRSAFDPHVQDSLAAVLNIHSTSLEHEIILDRSSRVEMISLQLASSLLSAWSARLEGPKAEIAFEELTSTLRQFFSLELRGTVGEIVEYNPRLHELPAQNMKRKYVRIDRPWVEIHQGQNAVVIKALVFPVERDHA
jgi:hypothetical protein